MVAGTIVGFAIGIWFAYNLIFPPDLLNIRLSELTIGNILRIIGGILVAVIIAGIGNLIGSYGEEKEREERIRKQYGGK